MKQSKSFILVAGFGLLLAGCKGGASDGAPQPDTSAPQASAVEQVVGLLDGATQVHAADASYDAEKQKAMANPYANDLGPSALPADVLAGYPKEHQDAYKNVLQTKCSRCHTPSRPLNSQFFEPVGKTDAEKQANLDALKKSDPDIFQNKYIWQPEAGIWKRYVKRMMSKPGCQISDVEGKAVWGFLVYDSNQRKIGKNKAAWKAHRTKLLEEFKAKYPQRYQELYGGGH